MSKKFELIRPRSLQNTDYEPFEFVIRWVGRNGAEYLYLFYDARLQRRVNSEVVNQEDEDFLQSMIMSENRSVRLKADNLSLNDLNVILQIFGNKTVDRLKKDGTSERMAPDANTYNYRLMDGRYEIEFDLIQADLKTWS